MTDEERVEALRGAVQIFIDEIPGATAAFTYSDAEAALEAIEREAEPVS